MKFTIISMFALVSVVLAVSQEEHNEFIKRQANTAGNVPVNVAAMTDKDGNVVLFDSNNVYLDSAAKGL
ncbi:hypothetical protein CONLIGDRAFT_683521 [Coniochaeta ligniaria NRRL 30616]|uniref:Uncharacterized protein n=1 Tax=Coniochaeta ligniaria NRRL 30616 TaxID=1408157 RepID=A0A1J7IFT1_9PEZI|nr:hypothetical protein CONLIGDRAFT_683521 [Coniochaeta ligniaria NRRL 30616]